jgi:hypothetical protein
MFDSSRLRNNGLFTPDDYKGKTLQEATKYAEEGGFIVRVTETDGNSIMVDMLDNKSNRLNFRVRQGFVIDVYGG